MSLVIRDIYQHFGQSVSYILGSISGVAVGSAGRWYGNVMFCGICRQKKYHIAANPIRKISAIQKIFFMLVCLQYITLSSYFQLPKPPPYPREHSPRYTPFTHILSSHGGKEMLFDLIPADITTPQPFCQFFSIRAYTPHFSFPPHKDTSFAF